MRPNVSVASSSRERRRSTVPSLRARSLTLARYDGPEPKEGGMGEVDRYPNGTFCWIDLGTPQVGLAKAFYGALFG